MNIRVLSIISLLLFWNLATLPVTTRLSCLENTSSGKKIVILYDNHFAQIARSQFSIAPDMATLEPILLSQQQELHQLINALSNGNEETLFLSECTSLRLGEISLGYTNNLLDTLLVVPKFFVKEKTNKIGTLQFDPGDPRDYIDIFAATNFVLDHEEWKKKLDNKTLDQNFSQITIGFYLNHITNIKNQLLENIADISFFDTNAQTIIKSNIDQTYDKLATFIQEAIKEHSLTETDHLLDLYAAELKNDNYYLMNRIVDFGSIYFDITLFDKIEASSHKKNVVQVGSLHAKLLEHRLIKQGYILAETYGDTSKYVVDENDYVSTTVELDDNGKMKIHELNKIDQIAIKFLA